MADNNNAPSASPTKCTRCEYIGHCDCAPSASPDPKLVRCVLDDLKKKGLATESPAVCKFCRNVENVGQLPPPEYQAGWDDAMAEKATASPAAPTGDEAVTMTDTHNVVAMRWPTDKTLVYLDRLNFAASEAVRTFEDAGDAMSWSPTIDAMERLKELLHGDYAYHSDDAAVDSFAEAMRRKMEDSREKGRSGWDSPFQCSPYRLAEMLIDHIPKGDPVDVGNFAMMLFNRPDARGILPRVWAARFAPQSAAQPPAAAEAVEARRCKVGSVCTNCTCMARESEANVGAAATSASSLAIERAAFPILKALYSELNTLRWISAVEGDSWDQAIDAVRKRIAQIIETEDK